ncbi:hypothetical protein WHR41_04121 [Cladosporium halotolerans]|uniref:Xylanolytic transcriptional activator regulatory domain-containing protein n=1 Tax=Cladosporium halotolerans TaxID=1052096 RepID=A0AB34KUI3_9PEZI
MASSSEAQTGETNYPSDGEPPQKRVRLSLPSTAQGRHREIGLMRWRPQSDAASFVGSSSGIHFIRSVYSAVEAEKSRAASPEQSPDRNLVPGEEDQLQDVSSSPSTKPLWQPHEVSYTESDTSQVVFHNLIQWSQSYFDNWHPAYPFLHAPSILALFKKISMIPLGRVPDVIHSLDLAMVRAVLSISLADRRQAAQGSGLKPVPHVLVYKSFTSAIDSVERTLSTPTSIKGIQAVLSVQVFLVSMLRHNAASRLGGLIVRMTFQIGLHRCPVRYASFTLEDIQLRKRIFWTVYCLDRHICQSLGLPLGVRDDDIDVCYLDFERHTSKTGIVIAPDDRLILLQFLVRHAEIKGLIVELCHKSINHRQADPDASTAIIARMNKWRNDLETILDTTHDSKPILNKYHGTTLSVLQHECTIILNRPLLAMGKDTQDYKAALQSCIGASRAIIGILHKYLTQVIQSDKQATFTPLLWPSFTWAAWQSAFIATYAAMEGELPKQNASRLADQSVDVLKHITARGGVWPNACAASIRDLSRHLNKPSRSASKPALSPDEPDHRTNPPGPSARFPTNGHTNPSPSPADALSTLAGAAEVHGAYDASRSTPFGAPPPPPPPQPQNPYSASTAATEAYIPTATPSAFPAPADDTSFAANQAFPAAAHGGYNPDFPPGSFFGQAGGTQQPAAGVGASGAAWPSDSLFDLNNVELFAGFDIPFWLDDEQYVPFLDHGGS